MVITTGNIFLVNSCWLSGLTRFLCASVSGPTDDVTKEYLRVYNVLRNLITLTSSTIQDPTALSELDKLQKILHGMSSNLHAFSRQI